ncbi:MAG: glutamine-hydrolyzing GMP synthase [Treponemataceae bacterium]|nr:glutamine-hydrolyzing GMP synthase [Treponemataceae bacterium]MDE7392582.1 glutamine-hydrolyzing GMP synthase [Treponemataceae bacterium]
MAHEREKIVVLDFGSQYAHLIAKRLRMLGYYSEIALPSVPTETLGQNVKGIILSGGPASVYDADIPECNPAIFDLPVPILGLCYGHHLMAQHYGGSVGKAAVGEFGFAQLTKNDAGKSSPLLAGVSDTTQVWMSHQDGILSLGPGFEVAGTTKDCPFAAVQDLTRKRFSLQCHCEVKDTPEGTTIFANFARLCGMERNWDEDTVLNHILASITHDASDKNILLFLSGGVDSTVAFALLNKALGQERVLGLHIDNGFMRKNESADVQKAYRAHGFTNFIVEDAGEGFLAAVKGLTDPQKKRMAVGEHFITVRNEVVARQHLDESRWMLAQGTLYPDIIESGGTKNSKTIKTHHNRVAGIQALLEQGLIIEPLKDLYKDEVRAIGKKLGLSDDLVMRHPFPGPGLSINVLCTDGTISATDEAEMKQAQAELDAVAFTQFCPHCTQTLRRSVLSVRSVGVQGDFRTYRFPAVLTFRAEENGFYHLPKKWEKLEAASSAVTNSAQYINRCVVTLWKNPRAKDEDFRLQEGYCDKRRLDQTRDADDIVLTALRQSGWYGKIFQHLTIHLPYATDAKRCSFVLRPVCSEDVMTARFAQLPQDVLIPIVAKIAALPYVDAIFYDVTNKPPATFGWE